MSQFTILGASGFIGSHLLRHLQKKGHEVFAPSDLMSISPHQDLGHVVYAIGLTGDFRNRPYDTVDAHINVLTEVLNKACFQSLLYLSSTRVYGGLPADSLAEEEAPLQVRVGLDAVYDLSKLLGESLCLMQANPGVRVARLSNVYGMGQSRHTFLQMLLDEMACKEVVQIREDPDSSKDYISIEDVVVGLEWIALGGRKRLYNVASGYQLKHRELVKFLAEISGKPFEFLEGAPMRRFPAISVSRLVEEFGWRPSSLYENLSRLVYTTQ